jgi:hypothetical protein
VAPRHGDGGARDDRRRGRPPLGSPEVGRQGDVTGEERHGRDCADPGDTAL